MDLVNGPKTVIVMMTHFNRTVSKLVRSCTLPLTGERMCRLCCHGAWDFYSQKIENLKSLS